MLLIKTQPVLLQVIYYRPDYPSIVQEFTWGFDDRVPELYRVHRFLNHWYQNIDAVIADILLSINEGPFTTYRSVNEFININ
jgi:uncharacterized protein Usg